MHILTRGGLLAPDIIYGSALTAWLLLTRLRAPAIVGICGASPFICYLCSARHGALALFSRLSSIIGGYDERSDYALAALCRRALRSAFSSKCGLCAIICVASNLSVAPSR